MADSIYSDPIVDVPKRPRPPGDILAARLLDRAFNLPLPAFPSDNLYAQSQRYVGAVYLGIQYTIGALSGARVELEKQRKDKGVAAPGARRSDPDYVPISQHPLKDVLRRPNEVDTFQRFLAQVVIQYRLHGSALIWGVPNKVGAPERLYVIPRPLCSPYPAAPGVYPEGAWRVMPYYPGGISALLPGQIASGAILPAREVYELKNPHHLVRWQAYSPLQAIAHQSDVLAMIDRSLWSVMQNGINPSGNLDLPGANEDQIAAVQAAIKQIHAGPENSGRVLITGGGGEDGRSAAKYSPFSPTARDMMYGDAWDRYIAFVLFAVCGVDPALVGLKDLPYAARWSARQDFREVTLEPFLSALSETLTHGPVKAWGLSDAGVRANISLPPLSDPASVGGIKDGAQDGSADLNEVRAARGLPPKEGGDVPVQVYLARLGAGPQKPKKPGMGDESTADVGDTTPEAAFAEPARPDTGSPEGALPPQAKSLAANTMSNPAGGFLVGRKRVLRGKRCRKVLKGLLDDL